MSYFLKQTTKGDKYYEVFYIVYNGKKRHCKYALSRHGKYAEMLAKYTNEHKKVLKQWYDIFDDYFIVNMYNSNEDKYYKCYVDLDDYDLVTKIRCVLYTLNFFELIPLIRKHLAKSYTKISFFVYNTYIAIIMIYMNNSQVVLLMLGLNSIFILLHSLIMLYLYSEKDIK